MLHYVFVINTPILIKILVYINHFVALVPKNITNLHLSEPYTGKKDQCTHTSWELLLDQIYYAEIDGFSKLDIFIALF